mmetsp:Transcript_26671/g.23629  ORF Transcript_26671/g.23629 Transcript_26671/m.23629 type:complete len:102 (+) Transcript_26671:37-342(+)
MLGANSKKSVQPFVNMITRGFSMQVGPFYERPIVNRVVSTNTWPVPYYQRLYKSYPVREKKDISLNESDFDIDDTNWYQAMEFLRETQQGKLVVDWVQNNL